ncbi:MAG TPA: class I SAM-dependent methyltransferase [Micromonosporaceae bacterium]|nr:class I SAM-dependent methyltransferase [Micromonosporaceae bacterium]
MAPDWRIWHEEYDHPHSALANRLSVVQAQVRAALDQAADGPIRVLSLVAGQGRDLIPVLADHPRRNDVAARLVELDPRIAEVARQAAADADLAGVEVVVGDAALVNHYEGLAPADLVLICGLFGNITESDVAHTIDHTASLTRRGGTVIWTRHRDEPDLVPRICEWFAEHGFALVWVSEPGAGYGVGVHRARRDPPPLVPGARLFTFVGYDSLGAP